MITVGLHGIEQLRSSLRNASENLKRQVDDEIDATAWEVRNKQVERVPVFQADLKGAITKEKVRQMEHTVHVQRSHAAYVEFGTKKKVSIPAELQAEAKKAMGKGRGSAEDALSNIKEWVRLKGIRFESAGKFKSGKRKGQNKMLTVEQTAYIIFHFIMLNGISPQPFFFPAWFEERPKLIERLSKIVING